MQIIVNGEPKSLNEGITAQELIKQLGLAEKRLAIEVNGEIVTRSDYTVHRLSDGDKVEIVHAVGGG